MYSLNSGPESTDLQDIPLDWPMYSLNRGPESTDLQDIQLDWPMRTCLCELCPVMDRTPYHDQLSLFLD